MTVSSIHCKVIHLTVPCLITIKIYNDCCAFLSQLMLSKYSEGGAAAWRGKDTAMYLVTSLAARGATQAAGVTRASPLVDLAQFARQHALPELGPANGEHTYGSSIPSITQFDKSFIRCVSSCSFTLDGALVN